MVYHIAGLATSPAWLEEMRRFTKELEKEPMYAGLGAAVAEQLKLLREQNKDGE